MVLSFIGAFVFVGIAVVTNQGIAYESYAYVLKKTDETNFSGFQQNVKSNVKLIYGASRDEYTEFLADASKEMNEGIAYLLDFLAIEDDLQKGDHNTLINSYDEYLANFALAKKAYDDYLVAYARAEETSGGDYATSLVVSSEKVLSDSYLNCYKSGSVFFKNLVRIVNQYSFNNSGFLYSCQRYIIKVGFCDYVVKQVFTETRGNITTNSLKIIFENYCINADGFGDDDVITSTNFKRFVNVLNSLNIYEWAGNYAVYAPTLANSGDALWAKNFFDEGRFWWETICGKKLVL